MSMQKQVMFWSGFLITVFLLLWVFRGILLPFVVGMALAYLLDPAADFLERCRFSRFWATSVVMGAVVIVIATAFVLLVPAIVQQVIGLVQRIPDYVNQLQKFVMETAPDLGALIGEERLVQFENSLSSTLSGGVAILGNLAAQVAQSGATIINVLALIIVTPVVAFYLLLDWDGMVAKFDQLLPREHRKEILEVLGDMDRAMAGVIRGQGSVIILLALFYGVSLTLAGLNFGLAIGLMAGIFSFVPYVGFLVGMVLSTGVAIVQYWPEPLPIFIVLGIFLVGQFLEGNVFYPKLVGNSIGVHPVWLMFALFAVGTLFGFVGLLLAVPMVAIVGVLVRYALKKYTSGSLYLGEGASGGEANGGTNTQSDQVAKSGSDIKAG